MYAVFGKIEFQVLAYFDGMELQFGADYVEHALIGRKPRLQFVGDKLDQVQIDLLFHRNYCDPEAELVRLKEALTSHDALALVLGNGDYKGRFVMTELSATARHTDPTGTLLAAEARMTLREFTGDPAQPSPPAVRTAGSALPMPARQAPVAAAGAGVVTPGATSFSGLAVAVTGAKAVMATASTTITAVSSLRSLATSNPLAAVGRLGAVAGNVEQLLPALGTSATAMGAFGQVAAVASDASRVASGFSAVQAGLSGVSGLASGATSTDVASRLASIEALTSRASLDLGAVQPALARLAARSAIRTSL